MVLLISQASSVRNGASNSFAASMISLKKKIKIMQNENTVLASLIFKKAQLDK